MMAMVEYGEDEADDIDEDSEEILFCCPYCCTPDDTCEHYLGSKDVHFSTGFGVDYGEPLEGLADLFEELDRTVSAFLSKGKNRANLAGVKPRRLRALLQEITEGSPTKAGKFARDAWGDGRAFSKYLVSVLRSLKIPSEVTKHEENSGPGFCSDVETFWAENVPAAVEGLRRRIKGDITQLTSRSS